MEQKDKRTIREHQELPPPPVPGDRYCLQENAKIAAFLRCGILTLSAIFLFGMLNIYRRNLSPRTAVTTSSQSARRYTVSNGKLPIYSVEQSAPKVSLTFDVAWSDENTAKILEILKKHNVRATFFLTGDWIDSFPEEVKAIARDGHDLGNHSENHKQMSRLDKESCIQEIMTSHKKVKELTGKEMILFRPPYGDYNDTLLQALEECSYYGIQWNIDSLDWKDYNADTILRNVCQNPHLGNGSIILCHNGARHITEALDGMISGLEAKGYEIVPVSQLIYRENYEIDAAGRQHQLFNNDSSS